MASWDGGVSRNINFVLPSGIPEKTFDAIRSNLPEVFRVTSIRDLTKTWHFYFFLITTLELISVKIDFTA